MPEYIEGFGPPAGAPLSPIAPGAPPQGGQYFELPQTVEQPPVTATEGGLRGPLNQAIQSANTFLSGARAATTRKMTQSATGEPTMGPLGTATAELLNPVPGNVFQAGMLAAPLAGTAVRSPLGKAAVVGGIDAALGGAEGGGMGALLGGAGGALAGFGGGQVGKLGQPTRGMQALGKTKEMGLKYGSPEVQQWLKGMQEQELTRGSALKGLQEAASKGIEDIVGHIKTTLPANQMVAVYGIDPRVINQYNASQSQTVQHIAGIQGQFGQTGVAGSFETMDKFRQWLRAKGDPAWRTVMDEMVYTADIHANSLGNTPAGQMYRAVLKKYAADKRIMDVVEGIQEIRSKGIIGNINPTDFPEAQTITDLALKDKGQRAIGAAETLVGATHPGIFGTTRMVHGIKKVLTGHGKQPIEGPLAPRGTAQKIGAKAGEVAIGAIPGIPRLPKSDEQ